MSATGRNLPGHERHPDDFYETPAWCVHALLRALPGFRPTLDPGCGTGAIAGACAPYGTRGIELDRERAGMARARGVSVLVGDALAESWRGERIIGNPPYNAAEEWCRKLASEAECGAFLLRLNVLGGQARAAFWRAHPPDFVGILSKRPSFAHGKTDATEYAWIGWNTGAAADGARLVWLAPEPAPLVCVPTPAAAQGRLL